MDNTKTNEGSARDLGREGAGSSMGKSTGGASGSGYTGTDPSRTTDKTTGAAPVVDRLATSAHEGVDKVSGALNNASARMDEKSRQLRDAYRHFTDTGRDYVRSSPATSLLVALAAGYTLAKLLGRRN